MLIDTPKLFQEYADYHTNSVNLATHYIGLPMGAIAAFGLLSRVELFAFAGETVTLGLAAVLAFTAVNMLVEPRLAALALIPAVAFLAIGQVIPVVALVVLLVLGLGIPLWGHIRYEKAWPDTLQRFGRFELVGHLWFLNEIAPIVTYR